MINYQIHPIATCEGIRNPSQYAFRTSASEKVKMVCYTWYVDGADLKVLVDTGARAQGFIQKGASALDINSVENGLSKFKLTPSDIDVVILTHLHTDHVELGYLYTNATFIVQQKEIDYAKCPHTFDAFLFESKQYENLFFNVVDGDTEIIPGISVLLSPGHTSGGQSVVINTSRGKAIITGFCSSFDTFSPTDAMKRRGWEVAIPTIHHDVRDTYNSVLSIKNKADIIIPSHDPAFLDIETI